MKFPTNYLTISIILLSIGGNGVYAQNSDSWSLNKCILYALDHNLQVKQSLLTTDINKTTADQTKASRLPIVTGSARETFSWNSVQNLGTNFASSTSNSSTYGVNASTTLFNGDKISNGIKQTDINYKASQFASETQKETISLNVLTAFLNLLFAEEQVKNDSNQILVTEGELKLANERYALGAIANSDVLTVKSQLATEKQTLATAEGLVSTSRVTLMQLMELPVNNEFSIEHPDLSKLIVKQSKPDPAAIYQIALGIKPQIKNAELNTQSAKLNVDIVKGNYFPNLSLSGGVSSSYSSVKNQDYSQQIYGNLNPTLGLSLSIPIYENKQLKSQVQNAQIGTQQASLQLQDTKNQLRKAIESACTDVITAENEYDASVEQYNSNKESFNVATEKFDQGLINSVDYLVQKTNLITSESTLLQSKYRLIFSYKTLDFYTGIPLTL